MTLTATDIKQAVRETYGAIASAPEPRSCCGSDCCTPTALPPPATGYTDAERASVPAGTDLGLGCGNPHAMAGLQPGDRVLDLGSGPGFDAILAAAAVGPTGHVIGVDMTPAMLERARANVAKTSSRHIEFRLGEIEHLPLADASVDVVMSNCVINLSPDKPSVFHEAFRVLVPGGRLAIADIVALRPLSEELRTDLTAHTGCVAGGALVSEIQAMLWAAGFVDVTIGVPASAAGRDVASATIEARKPA